MRAALLALGLALLLTGCSDTTRQRVAAAMGDAVSGAVAGTAAAGPVGGVVGGLLCFLAGLVPGRVSEKRRDAKIARREAVITTYRARHGELPARDYEMATRKRAKGGR